MVKEGRTLHIALSNDEYGNLVKLCLGRKLSVTGLAKEMLLSKINKTMEEPQENVKETELETRLITSTSG